MAGPAQSRESPADKAQEPAGILPSDGVSLNLPDTATEAKPAAETLNAHSHYGSGDDDGAAIHRINQYVIKQEIGRGSFGAVHLAQDQYGQEFAVKEFSKSRLRKRAQSNLLRRPNQKKHTSHLAAGVGFNSPLHRISSSDKIDHKDDNALDLIKEEIAIMKKLNHNNVVSLIEVLDDPDEDSLYMVLEMCKKGVVMKVGLEETADPYDEETCRCWFRDMVLGIEYLHAQGIVHRDIKPDNCLVTNDDVLKIVDFGVSEMFEKQSDMATAKSAGSPAFMPPELCVARHGQVSGRAADIWSMGVTLYCLRYGRIPFEKHGMLELYEAIRKDELPLHNESDDKFADLMHRILEKDPDRRITMEELRNHPWVTKNGTDPLLSTEENCSDLVDLPTRAEMDNAITGNMGQLLVVMKAVKRFKKLLFRRRPELVEGILGRSPRISASPDSLAPRSNYLQSRSADGHDRKPLERALTAEGVHHDLRVSDDVKVSPREIDTPSPARSSQQAREEQSSPGHRQDDETTKKTGLDARHAAIHRAHTFPEVDHAKGHAHDPLMDTLFLHIGTGAEAPKEDTKAGYVVSESPSAVEMNVYEAAYQEEMQRILDRRGKSATMYLTRRVEHNKDIREHASIIGQVNDSVDGLAGLMLKAARNVSNDGEGDAHGSKVESKARGKVDLSGLVQKARENLSKEGKDDAGQKGGESDA
ncbi:hypothetical protein MBLNU459_g5428t1 [Dothideomycetes sp. NU459]